MMERRSHLGFRNISVNPNIRKFKIFEAFGCGFGYYHIQNNDFDFKVLRFGRSVRQNPSLPGGL